MISARQTLEPGSIHRAAIGPRDGTSAVVRPTVGRPGHVFHASCRPHSWSLFGVHLRLEAGRAVQPAGVDVCASADARGMQRDEAAAASLAEAARSLAPQLGGCRVWLWCSGRIPSGRFVTLLAGSASLRGVSRDNLGLELSAQAVASAGEEGVRRLDELRSAGIGVLIRLSVPARPLSPARGAQHGAGDREATCGGMGEAPDLERLAGGLQRAHMLGLSAVATAVGRRDWAMQLGDAGFAAVSGPVVCSPTDLGGIRKFIGPAEPWLSRMRADSV